MKSLACLMLSPATPVAAETANYDAVKTGRPNTRGRRITYDPSKITYGTILKVFFTTAHDPTTLNRRGGCRPAVSLAIFYASDEQKQLLRITSRNSTRRGFQRSDRDNARPGCVLPRGGLPPGLCSQNPYNLISKRIDTEGGETRKVYLPSQG